MEVRKIKPWLNDDGSKKSEDQIKTDCKNWGVQLWEEYLQTQETEQRELLFDNPAASDNYSQQAHDLHIKSIFDKDDYPGLQQKLIRLMGLLSEKQRSVLHLLFWENLSVIEIAELTGITRQSVYEIKRRALTQLGSLLVKSTVSSIKTNENVSPLTNLTKSL